MERFCLDCGSKIVLVESCKDSVYFCEKCDEFYFEKLIISRCICCGWEFNKSYEIVKFNEFSKNQIIDKICLECAKEMY